MRSLIAQISRVVGKRDGSVSVVAALTLPILLVMGGFVIEYGQGLLHKVEDQRVADAAAFTAATQYAANSAVSITSVADSVASLNGIPSADVTANLVTSPSGDGNNAVEVTITTSVPLMLSQALGANQTTLSVTASSYAELTSGGPGCIFALNAAGSGVALSSSSSITADKCAVESAAEVTCASSSPITTPQVDYGSATDLCTDINGVSGGTVSVEHASVSDPLANNSDVSTAVARLASVEALTSPSAPSVTSVSGTLSFSSTSYTGTSPCATPTRSGSTWTITCSSGGDYDFGTLSAASSTTVDIVTTGSSATTYNFGSISATSSTTININTASTAPATYSVSGGVVASSSSHANFGPGTFDIAQGVMVATSSSASFGAGTFDIGPATTACTDGGDYSLCVESSTSLTIGGPSSFTLGGGIYAGSSADITLGAGTTNSFDIGKSSNGNAIETSSSSNVVLADATGASDVFEADGTITAASSACVALPDAAQHDINGALVESSSSNVTLGSGVYTIADYFEDGSSSGGGSCLGSTAGTADTGVTLVLGALSTPSSGTCDGMAICVTSSSGMAIDAPSSGATAGLAVIGPTSSSNTAGALFDASSSGSLSGAVYFPYGLVKVESSSSLGGGTTTCLELIGAEVDVQSSSAIGTTCSGLGGSTGGSVALVK